MDRFRTVGILAAVGLMMAACASQSVNPRVDPFPLRFPLVEAGTLEIEGHVVGQPRVQDNIVYYLTREGYLTAVAIPSRAVMWQFKADHTLSSSPEIHGDIILFHDDDGVLYGIVRPGQVLLKKPIDTAHLTPAHIIEGGVVVGTAEGRILWSDPGGNNAREHQLPGPQAGLTAGPVPAGGYWQERIIFGRSDGRLTAIALQGKPVWEFRAVGAIQADPAVAGGRVYFGDSDRYFYCLDEATGKKIWSRRLQGAPLHPALIRGNTVAVAASNSVVYLLSRKGGSILSWEAVPSRVVYEPAAAGPLALISSASPAIVALDLRTGKRVGQYEAPGPLAASAVWSSPYVVLFVEDEASGRQKIVFLRSR